ncbi:hypothetical protein CNECB9_1020005 [Cupriavidus necator]|uniref:Uncharacterized protein n=1 Tax=Cupriavidus necator TaxID=106590 RepID=A0A1K0J5Z4_CUPNE|nr:hypothetical protein CNECB9_1020005 [Cupriavidus necator]
MLALRAVAAQYMGTAIIETPYRKCKQIIVKTSRFAQLVYLNQDGPNAITSWFPVPALPKSGARSGPPH